MIWWFGLAGWWRGQLSGGALGIDWFGRRDAWIAPERRAKGLRAAFEGRFATAGDLGADLEGVLTGLAGWTGLFEKRWCSSEATWRKKSGRRGSNALPG